MPRCAQRCQDARDGLEPRKRTSNGQAGHLSGIDRARSKLKRVLTPGAERGTTTMWDIARRSGSEVSSRSLFGAALSLVIHVAAAEVASDNELYAAYCIGVLQQGQQEWRKLLEQLELKPEVKGGCWRKVLTIKDSRVFRLT